MRTQTLILYLIFSVLWGQTLPHNLTDTERLQLDQIGMNRQVTDPPDYIQFAPAEFDSLSGIIFSWRGFPTLLTQLIKEVAEEDTAWVIVNGSTEATTVSATLTSNGVNMNNIAFESLPSNTVWIRDYGPWWIYDELGDLAVIDLVYNRPRPLDDAIPEAFAGLYNVDFFGTDLTQAGGNMLLDGKGVVIVSDIIFDGSEGFDPTLTQTELEETMLNYFGVHKVIVVSHMELDGTGHVDMFVKIINDTTIIVGEYTSASTGAGNNYAITNSVASQLAAETNGAGRPFTIERMLMPPYSGGITYTYINSLIVNKKIFVPVYGFSTDQQVLDQYEAIAPGYEAIGFDCNDIITSNGAIHCIAIKVPAKGVVVPICSDWISGDVNKDGMVDIFDVFLIADQATSGESRGLCFDKIADINADNEITIYDVALLVVDIMRP